MVFEKLVSKILVHYLSDYIEAIDPKMFEISALKGEVSLSNLNVKSTALASIHPSIEIQKGTVQKLNAVVPWRHIKSRPSTVHVSGIYLLASFKSTTSIDSKFTEEKERKQLIEKWSILDAWEEEQADYLKGKKKAQELDDEELLKSLNDARNINKKKEEADDDNDDDDDDDDDEENIAKDGFGLKFVKNIIRNLTVIINDTHVRIELVQPIPLAIGVAFEALELVSTNPMISKKEQSQVDMIPIVKQLTLKNFCIYINPAFQSYFDEKSEDMAKHFAAGTPHKGVIPPHCYILKPVTLTAVVNMNPRGLTKQGLPKFSLDLDIPTLPIRLISSQLSAFYSQPVNWLTFGMSTAPLYHKRPDRPPSYVHRHRHTTKTLTDNSTNKSKKEVEETAITLPTERTREEKLHSATGLYASKWWRHIIIAQREQLWLKRPIPYCTTTCKILPELNDKPMTLLLTIYAIMHIREKHGWGWIVDKSGVCRCDEKGLYANSVSKVVSDAKDKKNIFDYTSLSKKNNTSIGCRYCGGRTRLLAMEGRGGMTADMIRMGRQAAHDYLTKRGYNPGNFQPGSKEFIKQQRKYKVPEPKLPNKTNISEICDEDFLGGWVGMSPEEFKRLVFCVETIQKRQQLLNDLKEARDKNKENVTSFVQAQLHFGGMNMELCLAKEDILGSSGLNTSSPFLALKNLSIPAEKYNNTRVVNGLSITEITPFAKLWLSRVNGSFLMKSDNSMNISMIVRDLGARNYCCDNANIPLEENNDYPIFMRKMPQNPARILYYASKRYDISEQVNMDGAKMKDEDDDDEDMDMDKPLITAKISIPGKSSISKETSYPETNGQNTALYSQGGPKEYITKITPMKLFVDMLPLQITLSEKAIVSFISGLEIVTGISNKAIQLKKARIEQLIKEAKAEMAAHGIELYSESDDDNEGGTGAGPMAEAPWKLYENINQNDLRKKATSIFKTFPIINVKCSAPVIILPILSANDVKTLSQLVYINCGDLEASINPYRDEKEIELRRSDGTTEKTLVYLDPEDPSQTPDITKFVYMNIKGILKGTSIYNPMNKEELIKCIKLKRVSHKMNNIIQETTEESSSENLSSSASELQRSEIAKLNESTLFHPFCVEVGGSMGMIGKKIGYKSMGMKVNMRGWDIVNSVESQYLPVTIELNSERIFDLLTNVKFMLDRILTKSLSSFGNPKELTGTTETTGETITETTITPSTQTINEVHVVENEEKEDIDEEIEFVEQTTFATDPSSVNTKKTQRVPSYAFEQDVMDLTISCNNIIVVFNIKQEGKKRMDKCEIVIGRLSADLDIDLLKIAVAANLGETRIRYTEDNYYFDLFRIKALKNVDAKSSLVANISILNQYHPQFIEEGMKIDFNIGSLVADLNLSTLMKIINVMMGFSTIASGASMSLSDISNKVTDMTSSIKEVLQNNGDNNDGDDDDDNDNDKEGALCPAYAYTGNYTKELVMSYIEKLTKRSEVINKEKPKMKITGSVTQMKAIIKDNYSHPTLDESDYEDDDNDIINNNNVPYNPIQIPYYKYITAFISKTDVLVCSNTDNDTMNISVAISDLGIKEKEKDSKKSNDVLWTRTHGNNSIKEEQKEDAFLDVDVISIPETSIVSHGIPLYIFVSATNKSMYVQFRPSLFVILTNSGLLNMGSDDTDNKNNDDDMDDNKDNNKSSGNMDLIKLQRKLDLKLPSVYRKDVPSLYEECQKQITQVKEKDKISMLMSLNFGELQVGMRVSDGEALKFLKDNENIKTYDYFVFSIKDIAVASSYPMLCQHDKIIKKHIYSGDSDEDISQETIEDIKAVSKVYTTNKIPHKRIMLSRYAVSVGAIDIRYMIAMLNKEEYQKLGNDPNYNLVAQNCINTPVLSPISVSVNAMMPLLYNTTIKAVARGNINKMYLDIEMWGNNISENYITGNVKKPQTQEKALTLDESEINMQNVQIEKKPIGLILSPVVIQALLKMLSAPSATSSTKNNEDEEIKHEESCEATGTIGFIISYTPEKKNDHISMSINRQKRELPPLVSELVEGPNGEIVVDKSKNLPYVIRQYCTKAGTDHSDLPDEMCKGTNMALMLFMPGIELTVMKVAGDGLTGLQDKIITRETLTMELVNLYRKIIKLASFSLGGLFVQMIMTSGGFKKANVIRNPKDDATDRLQTMELFLILGSITAEIASGTNSAKQINNNNNTENGNDSSKSVKRKKNLRVSSKFGLGISGVGSNCIVKGDNNKKVPNEQEGIEGIDNYRVLESETIYKKLTKHNYKQFRSNENERVEFVRTIKKSIGKKAFINVIFRTDNYNFSDINVGIGVLNVTARPSLLYDMLDFVFSIKIPTLPMGNTQNQDDTIYHTVGNNLEEESRVEKVDSTVSKVLESKRQTGLFVYLDMEAFSLDLISQTKIKNPDNSTETLLSYSIFNAKIPRLNAAIRLYTLLNETTSILTPIIENVGLNMNVPIMSYWSLIQQPPITNNPGTLTDKADEQKDDYNVIIGGRKFIRTDRRYFLKIKGTESMKDGLPQVNYINNFSVIIKNVSDVDPNDDIPNDLILVLSFPEMISLNLSLGDVDFVSHVAEELLAILAYVSHKKDMGEADEVAEVQDGKARELVIPDNSPMAANGSEKSNLKELSTTESNKDNSNNGNSDNGKRHKLKNKETPSDDSKVNAARLCKYSGHPYIATKVNIRVDNGCNLSIVLEDSNSQFSPVVCVKISLISMTMNAFLLSIPGHYVASDINTDVIFSLNLNQFNPRVLAYEPLVSLPRLELSANIAANNGVIPGLDIEKVLPRNNIGANLVAPKEGIHVCIVPETMFLIQKVADIAGQVAEKFTNIITSMNEIGDNDIEDANASDTGSIGGSSSFSHGASSSMNSASTFNSRLVKYTGTIKKLNILDENENETDNNSNHVNTQLPRMLVKNFLSTNLKFTFVDVNDEKLDKILDKIDNDKLWVTAKPLEHNKCSGVMVNLPDFVTDHVATAHVICSFKLYGKSVILLAPMNHEYSVTRYIELNNPEVKKSKEEVIPTTLLNIYFTIDHNKKVRKLSIGSPFTLRNCSSSRILCSLMNKDSYYRALQRDGMSGTTMKKEIDANNSELYKYIEHNTEAVGAADITGYLNAGRDNFIGVTKKLKNMKDVARSKLFVLDPGSEGNIPIEYLSTHGGSYILSLSSVNKEGKEIAFSSVALSALIHDNIVYEVAGSDSSKSSGNSGKASQEKENTPCGSLSELFKSITTNKKAHKSSSKKSKGDIGENNEEELNADVELDNLRAIKIVLLGEKNEGLTLLSKIAPVSNVVDKNYIEGSSSICGFFKMEGEERTTHYKFSYERSYKNITRCQIFDAVKFINNHSVPLIISRATGEKGGVISDVIMPHKYLCVSDLAPTNKEKLSNIEVRVGSAISDSILKTSAATINIACLTSLFDKNTKDSGNKGSKKKDDNVENKYDEKKSKGMLYSGLYKLTHDYSPSKEFDRHWDGYTSVVISSFAALSPLVVSFGPTIIIQNNIFAYKQISLGLNKAGASNSNSSKTFNLKRNEILEIGSVEANDKQKKLSLIVPSGSIGFAPLAANSKTNNELAPEPLGSSLIVLKKVHAFKHNALAVGNMATKEVIKPGCAIRMELHHSRAIVNRTDRTLAIISFKSITESIMKQINSNDKASSMKAISAAVKDNASKANKMCILPANGLLALDSISDKIVFLAVIPSDMSVASEVGELKEDVLKCLNFSGPIDISYGMGEGVNNKDTQLMLVQQNPLDTSGANRLIPINVLCSLRTHSTINVLTIVPVKNDDRTPLTEGQLEQKEKEVIHEMRHVSKCIIRNNLVWSKYKLLGRDAKKDKERLAEISDSLVILQCLDTQKVKKIDSLIAEEANAKPYETFTEIEQPEFVKNGKSISSDFIKYELKPKEVAGIFGFGQFEKKDAISKIVLLIGICRRKELNTTNPCEKCTRWFRVSMDEKVMALVPYNNQRSIRIVCKLVNGRQCLTFSFGQQQSNKKLHSSSKSHSHRLNGVDIDPDSLPPAPLKMNVNVKIPRIVVTLFDSYPMPAISIHLHELMVQMEGNTVVDKRDGLTLNVCDTTQQLMRVSAALNLIQVQLDNTNIRNSKGKVIKGTYCKFPVIFTRDCRTKRNTPMMMARLVLATESGPNASALTYIPLIDVQISPFIVCADQGIINTAMKILYDYKILGVEHVEKDDTDTLTPIDPALTTSLTKELTLEEKKKMEVKFICVEKMNIGAVSLQAFLSVPRILKALTAIEVNNGGGSGIQTVSLIPPGVMVLVHILMPGGTAKGGSIIKSKIEDEGLKVAVNSVGMTGTMASSDALGVAIGDMYMSQLVYIISKVISSNFDSIAIDFGSIFGTNKMKWNTLDKFFTPFTIKHLSVSFNSIVENFERAYTKKDSPFTSQLYEKESRSQVTIKIDLKSLNPLNRFKQLNVMKAMEATLDADRLKCLPSYHVNKKLRYIPCRD